MNDDSFEIRLREIARESSPTDPTPAWKKSILVAAMARPVRHLPPRSLLLAWAAAWGAIAFFHWSGPRSVSSFPLAHWPANPPQNLFAYHEQLLRQLELP